MKLILLGAPASGKGTVAKKLAAEFKLEPISAGELLRQEVNSNTTIGKKIKKTIESGDLVPDHLVIEIVRLFITGKDNFILDGFPRTLHQAKDIQNLNINKAIYLKISEQDAVKRISQRRICEQGIHTYHLTVIPPKQPGICDVDGSKLIQRKDDLPKTVRERFRVYIEKTKPLIQFYRQEGILITIGASLTPEEVYQQVKTKIDEIS